mmetsp:Transcript_48195/g.153827  ORF Transcript_48195/g.153827 Transcript_48195/m.153827 type:complete len:315 (+) Transcript_48195:121-1065(+)
MDPPQASAGGPITGEAAKGCGIVAITGAAGFLGQLVRQECDDLGLRVMGIDLAEPHCQGGPKIPGAMVADASKVDKVCDLGAEGAQVDGLLEGCSCLVHLAADGRPSAGFLESVLPNNITATYRILEEARRAGVKRVVFASSNHVQHGETATGGSPGGMDWARLDALGGVASLRTTDPLARAGPDSFYGVSKLCGEALGSLYSRFLGAFEFVALRIGWCLYDKPTALRGTENEAYLRSMWLSQRDFRGFVRGALTADLTRHRGFLVAYAVSRNGRRLFDIEESVQDLGYDPLDDAEDYFSTTSGQDACDERQQT